MRGHSAGPSPRCETAAGQVPPGPPRRRGRRPARQRRRETVAQAWPWQSTGSPTQGGKPPRPHESFSREDVKRIKEKGPRLADIVLTEHVQHKSGTGDPRDAIVDVEFVPDGVFGDRVEHHNGGAPEPHWRSMPQMPLNLFVEGLKRRNWTHARYDPSAPKWHVDLWANGGTYFPALAWEGYRAVVHQEGEEQPMWVAMPRPGSLTYVSHYRSGATHGAQWDTNPDYLTRFDVEDPRHIGYNQVFEQLFEAHQEQLSDFAWEKLKQEAPEHMTVPRKKLGMDDNYAAHNPYVGQLEVTYQHTPTPDTQLRFRNPLQGAAAESLLIPAAIIGAFVFSLGRSNQGMPRDMEEAREYAQSSGTARKDGATGASLADVAGLDTVLDQFNEYVSYLQNPEAFTRNGVRAPKGLLLEGPPGIGKTLIAKAIAGEAKVAFYATSAAEFVEIVAGVGAARVRDLFRRANAYDDPAVIFIDEIDAIGVKRVASTMNADEEREQTLNQLLTELDGFTPASSVLFIAATNRADLLDPALLRMGRFDRAINIPRPDADARLAILQVHARKHRFAEDADLRQVANDTPALVGADLANVLNNAAIYAVRDGSDVITAAHLQESRDREVNGDRKPTFNFASDDGKVLHRTMAAYEGARALLTELKRLKTPECSDAVAKVSLVRRGVTNSRVVYIRGHDEEYFYRTKQQILHEIHVTMAGAVAIEVLELEPNTMPMKDLQLARKLVESYVEVYCMSDAGVTPYYEPVHKAPRPSEGILEVDKLYVVPQLLEDAPGGLIKPIAQQDRQREILIMDTIRALYNDTKAELAPVRKPLEVLTEELMRDFEVSGERIREILQEHGFS